MVYGLWYRIPGKGNAKTRDFQTDAARQKFVEKLIVREGSDVEVRFSDEIGRGDLS